MDIKGNPAQFVKAKGCGATPSCAIPVEVSRSSSQESGEQHFSKHHNPRLLAANKAGRFSAEYSFILGHFPACTPLFTNSLQSCRAEMRRWVQEYQKHRLHHRHTKSSTYGFWHSRRSVTLYDVRM